MVLEINKYEYISDTVKVEAQIKDRRGNAYSLNGLSSSSYFTLRPNRVLNRSNEIVKTFAHPDIQIIDAINGIISVQYDTNTEYVYSSDFILSLALIDILGSKEFVLRQLIEFRHYDPDVILNDYEGETFKHIFYIEKNGEVLDLTNYTDIKINLYLPDNYISSLIEHIVPEVELVRDEGRIRTIINEEDFSALGYNLYVYKLTGVNEIGETRVLSSGRTRLTK